MDLFMNNNNNSLTNFIIEIIDLKNNQEFWTTYSTKDRNGKRKIWLDIFQKYGNKIEQIFPAKFIVLFFFISWSLSIISVFLIVDVIFKFFTFMIPVFSVVKNIIIDNN